MEKFVKLGDVAVVANDKEAAFVKLAVVANAGLTSFMGQAALIAPVENECSNCGNDLVFPGICPNTECEESPNYEEEEPVCGNCGEVLDEDGDCLNVDCEDSPNYEEPEEEDDEEEEEDDEEEEDIEEPGPLEYPCEG